MQDLRLSLFKRIFLHSGLLLSAACYLTGCCGSGTNTTTVTHSGGGTTPPTNRPVFITVTPNGKFAYVADAGVSSIAQYSIGSTGQLIPLSPAMVTTNISKPSAIAISEDSQFAYVTNQGNNTVALFKIGTSGALNPMSPATVSVKGTPSRLFAATNGVLNFLYVGYTAGVAGYQIKSTGALVSVGADTAVGPVADLSESDDNDGDFTLHMLNSSAQKITDAGINADGTLSVFTPSFPTGKQPAALVRSKPGNALFALNQGGNSVSSYDTGNGNINSLVATIPVGNGPVSGADIEGDGSDALFIVNSGSNTVSEFTYDTQSATNQLLPVNTAATGTNPAWVAVSPDIGNGTTFVYVANQDGTVSQYTINNFGALAPLSPASVKG